MRILLFGFILLTFMSCERPSSDDLPIVEGVMRTPESHLAADIFELDKAYWYSGKAEVSKYELSQNRYKDNHDGEMVLIFVTEDFLTDRQVKNDNYTNKNSVSVLKTNQLRRFTTGLYDYSMMTSVFTRADGSGTEKITLSSQDWCGQSFVQINKKGRVYSAQQRSYFESEGDKEVSIKADYLEDELLNLIRINPESISSGTYKILPSLVYLRLTHKPMEAIEAQLSKTMLRRPGKATVSIDIKYPAIDRMVNIIYESEKPYKIVSITDTYPSMFDKKSRSTTAIKVSEMYDAYWSMNSVTERNKRQELMITGFSN